MADIRTPQQWYDMTIGKKIDTDNYPRTNPYQCWDYFDYFCRKINFDGSRYCSITRYVGDLWLLRDSNDYHYYTAFEYIIDPSKFKTGDWIFWNQHVAMFYEGEELGQNQPYPYVTLKSMNWSGILGAMRWKGWKVINIPFGSSDITLNDHTYHLYKQTPHDKIAVVGAGLNQVKTIRELDANVLVYAKLTGANYFQMKTNQADPYGTTYGDISAPMSGEYQSLPNQDNTLYYDLEDSTYGDCTWYEVNNTHNVFSPALVFPNKNSHWEYARMVGLNHIHTKSIYSFLLKYRNGYCLGIAKDELTPEQIAQDFSLTDMVHIAFLDGGDSAQMGRWNNSQFEYVRDTKRAVPSAIIMYRDFIIPSEEEKEVQPDIEDTIEIPIITEGDQDMTQTNPATDVVEPIQVQPQPQEDTKEDVTILGQTAKLIDVKSIITIILICTLCYLVATGKQLDEHFMTVIIAVITFYFSYQVRK